MHRLLAQVTLGLSVSVPFALISPKITHSIGRRPYFRFAKKESRDIRSGRPRRQRGVRTIRGIIPGILPPRAIVGPEAEGSRRTPQRPARSLAVHEGASLRPERSACRSLREAP